MISPAHARAMARYNRWQNGSLYTAADGLDEAERKRDRRAFFGSIHATLAHILWADRVWMNRFAATPPTAPEDAQGTGPAYQDWDVLTSERADFDRAIIDWAQGLTNDWLAGRFSPGRHGGYRHRDAARLAAGDTFFQSPNPSPRPGPRPAHQRWREDGRHRSVPDAG